MSTTPTRTPAAVFSPRPMRRAIAGLALLLAATQVLSRADASDSEVSAESQTLTATAGDPQRLQPAERNYTELHFENGTAIAAPSMQGGDARLQLLVTAKTEDGELWDVTRQVEFVAEPAEFVSIDEFGSVIPLADGNVTVTAQMAGGLTASTQIEVHGIGSEPPIHFANRVVPVFTKLGCNGGGCHGKISGQNGFRLSLLGFEPQDDHGFLVKESRGRRVSPAAPERSLLLTKGTNEVPHGGGQRMDRDSYEYRLLWRWIAQGMPYGDPEAATVESIEVFPQSRRLAPGESQQLALLARYTDGSVEDVTGAAVYESNDPAMADVSPQGLVQLNRQVGDVAVMARFQGKVAVFHANIPLLRSADAAGQQQAAADESSFPEPVNSVDRHVFAKLQTLGIPPSPPCDDATFLRRATLDIAGRLPTLEEVVAFADDPAPSREKRERLIDRLLDSPDYAEYFAGKWGAILRNRRSNPALQLTNLAFHQWLRESLAENKSYDRIVRELLTASGSPVSNPPVAWFAQVPDTEQRTEDAAQLFLGQRIQCARCHHHPYEKWSQADYAQLSAFFTLVTKKGGDNGTDAEFVSRPGTPGGRHPKTGQTLPPAGLDAEPVPLSADDDPRAHLVDWMVAPDNPFFARALVNRYWKHFLGRGLVEPEDDLRITNPPSNPELMDALAEEFVNSGYDLKHLIRLICTSHTYGVSSDAVSDNLDDRRSHSRFYPKRLTAEVLLDAVDTVTNSPTAFAGMPAGTRAAALPDTNFSSYFLSVFGRPESTTACECERSQESNLAQSLHLLNSEEIQGKLSTDSGRAAAMAAEDSADDREKVIKLYRIALARPPADDEMEAVLQHLSSREDRRAAMEDVIWSLINSKEFLFNH